MCEDAARFVPGLTLSGCNDRPEGDVEARPAIMLRGFSEDPLHHRSHSSTRLAEKRIDVTMLRANTQCGIRGATKVDRHMRLLRRAHFEEGFFDVVKASLEVERFLRCPYQAQNFQIFVGPPVALIMAQPIAITMLFAISAAGDNMQPQPTVGEVVERGGCPCC